MTSPETRPEGPRRRRSLLGAVAYILVPGERRRRSALHFRRAGLEALRDARKLVRPEKPPAGGETRRRERIEIE